MLKNMRIRVCLAALLSLATMSVWGMIPPQYADNENYRAKGPVSRVIVKMFEAVDKGDRVETGAMQEHPVMVDYSESGLMSKVTEVNKNGDLLFYFTVEEKDGQPSSHKRYSNKEWMEAYSTFEYNKGRLQVENVYDSEGELFYTEVYTYNKSGQLLNIVRRNKNGEILQTLEYGYDDAGHRTMERMKGKADRFIYRKKMNYDAQGHLTGEEYHNQEGLLKSKNQYTYNAEGDIDYIRQGVPGGAVNTTKVVYEYDGHQNWTRCILYANDCVPTTIIYRQIEYR